MIGVDDMSNRQVNWMINSEETIYDASPWVSVYLQEVQLPDGHVVSDYHRVQLPDFTVVYAKPSSDKLLMLKQYKHGLGEITYTLPGGMIEEGEAPLVAAKRELLEETGFRALDWQPLGSFVVNGNLGCGRGHFFQASYAIETKMQNSGDLEKMDVKSISESDLPNMLETNKISLLNHMACISLVTAMNGGS